MFKIKDIRTKNRIQKVTILRIWHAGSQHCVIILFGINLKTRNAVLKSSKALCTNDVHLERKNKLKKGKIIQQQKRVCRRYMLLSLSLSFLLSHAQCYNGHVFRILY